MCHAALHPRRRHVTRGRLAHLSCVLRKLPGPSKSPQAHQCSQAVLPYLRKIDRRSSVFVHPYTLNLHLRSLQQPNKLPGEHEACTCLALVELSLSGAPNISKQATFTRMLEAPKKVALTYLEPHCKGGAAAARNPRQDKLYTWSPRA